MSQALQVSKIFRNSVALLLVLTTLFAAKLMASDCDVIVLDSLYKNGLLTSEEYVATKKEMASIPVIVSQTTPINISAKLQGQFRYIDIDFGDGVSKSTSDIIARRMILTFATDRKLDWGAQLSFDFVMANKMSITYMWRRFESSLIKGEFRFGYIKPNFCKEENMPITNLFCTERSIATYYWGGPRNARRLGFGSFMTGAYWYGDSNSVENLKYALGVSNSENYKLGYESIGNGETDNTPNIWLSSSYDLKFDTSKITFGLNLGYGEDANKVSLPHKNTASIWGANPYIMAECDNARMLAEFLVSGVEDGAERGGYYERAYPMGGNLNLEYKFDAGEIGKIAPVFRFTFLNTDGRGVLPVDGLRQCPTHSTNSPYDRARGYYAGINWYLIGNSIKFQFGYEYAEFTGGVGGVSASRKACANTFRTLFQCVF